MHYTSVPNIRKVIDPLFLDGLRSDIQKDWDKPAALQKLLHKLGHIHVFDPACGSGNFLVVAYRQLRELEMTLLQRLAALNGNDTMELFSAIPIANFHGIECADFAAETAKLALFIAEYQANALFAERFGRAIAPLPLREAAHIVCGNALRLDWEAVCPPPGDGELVYIIGNPPFLGKQYQNAEQKEDMAITFSGSVKNYKGLDYVAAWFFKTARYIQGRQAEAALVSTNSLCQGQAVNALWPDLLGEALEISFAHTSFKWRNNASHNAAVICIIVGLRNRPEPKTIATPKRLFIGETEHQAQNINAYLLDAPNVYIEKASKSLFGLPEMLFGNMPIDNGHLILSLEEKDQLLQQAPHAEPFIRRFMGSREAINDLERYCLWIEEATLKQAKQIPPIAKHIEAVSLFRQKSKRAETVSLSSHPWRFGYLNVPPSFSHAYLVPSVSSERRPYLPAIRVKSDTISSNLNFVLYDAPEWCFALLVSRLHLAWIAAVCGKLKTDFRYSNTLGWHTFPVPALTEADKEALKQSGRAIMRVRAYYFDKNLAELYDPDKMPADLREAHRANDALLEGLYNKGQPFTNDTQRLEHLFRRYAARVAQSRKKQTVRKKRSTTKKQEG
nr:DNA methyltransferase [Parasaccharibacter sp. TMW 2.1884]